MERPHDPTVSLPCRSKLRYGHISECSKVEVTSMAEGFVDSWFEAKVVKAPEHPKSRLKRKRLTLIEYVNLVNEKGTQLLKEKVDVVLLRPLPPKVLMEGDDDFREGDLVDCFERDGWWTGKVKTVVTLRNKEEGERYLARFEDPEHEIEFRREDMRVHLDWMNGKWFHLQDDVLQELSITADGHVTLANNHCRSGPKELVEPKRQVVMGLNAESFVDDPATLLDQTLSPGLSASCQQETIYVEYPKSSSTHSPPSKKLKRPCAVPFVHVNTKPAELTIEDSDGASLFVKPSVGWKDNDISPLRDCQHKETGGKNDPGVKSSRCFKRRKIKKQLSEGIPVALVAAVVKEVDDVHKDQSMEEHSLLAVGRELTHEKRGEVQVDENVRKIPCMEDQSLVSVGTEMTHKGHGEVQKVMNVHKNPSLEIEAVGTEVTHGEQDEVQVNENVHKIPCMEEQSPVSVGTEMTHKRHGAMQTAAKKRFVSGRTRVRPSSALAMRNTNLPTIVEVYRRRLGPYSNKYSYLCKDSIVEVTGRISGYVGSWYEAKVLKPPQLPKSKFKRKREMLVEYTNLLNKNWTRLLRESLDVVLVRPLPPRIVADVVEEEEEEEEELIFEVGDEVNTYNRDGWWAGVLDRVVRRRTEDGKEEVSYVVRFEGPKHEIEFRGHKLRLHLDWYDGKWFVSRGQKSQELLVTANGCVSLASIRNSFKETTTIDRPVALGFSAIDFPKMAAFEERSSPIKRKTSRCLPMRFLPEIIDPEYPRGSSFPAKKIKRTCMEDPLVPVSGTSAESTSELCDAEPLCLRPASRLTYNDVNPLRKCENKEAGSSVTGAFNGKDNANNHARRSNRKRKSSKPTRIILPTRTCVVEKADGVYNKSSIEEQLFVGTRPTHEEKRGEVQNIEDVSKFTSMEDQSNTAVGTDLTDKERGEVRNQESIHKNPSVEEASHMVCRTELNSMEQGHSHVVENGGMSLGTEGVSGEQRAGDAVAEVDQSLPFVKSSPIWQAVESLEVFQKFPQNPHFLPLIAEREGVREGLAIAKMVTFANTAENIIKLSIDNPAKRFTDCLETIRSLKLHGFDTQAMENRLTKLIALKDKGQKMEEQKNEIENQNSELTHENAQLAKDICEIVDKIRSYQEQLASALLSKEEKDGKISILNTSLNLMDRMIRGTQASFEELNISW